MPVASTSRRSRKVACNRSSKAMFTLLPPFDGVKRACARVRVPCVMHRVISLTRLFFVYVITVAIRISSQATSAPGPGVRLTFSREAR